MKCKNPGCENNSRKGAINSAYCQECSDKYRKMNAQNRMMTGTTSMSKDMKGGEQSEK